MDTTSLFAAALQLSDPWSVSGVEFRDGADGRRELHITIGFRPGARFHCPEAGCGEASCPGHGVRAVPVPWARPGSGFTLLFKAMVVELAKSQPVADVAEQVGEHDTRLRRFIRHYVQEARLCEDHTGVEAIGIDETSCRGHNYITVVADLAERNVINVTPGKDADTVKQFALDFMARNGDPNRVRLVTCDMSLGFAKGIRQWLPNAAKVIDKFHVIKHANEAVDRVRKAEGRENGLSKRTKYLWLKNEANLTELQLQTKRSLQRQRLKTARACRMREPPRYLRHQRQPGRGRNRVQAPVFVDDEVTPGAHENPRPPAPLPPAGHPGLLRPPVHQRDPRRTQQHHPARQDPCPGLPQHGVLLHDDLPDLRQTRPTNRHHLTGSHPHQTAKGQSLIYYLK